jgi:transcriptional regulator NrdR family protein
MKCPICRADEKFVRTFETIQHRNMTERRKLCNKCSSAWKTIEQILEKKGEERKAVNETEHEEYEIHA